MSPTRFTSSLRKTPLIVTGLVLALVAATAVLTSAALPATHGQHAPASRLALSVRNTRTATAGLDGFLRPGGSPAGGDPLSLVSGHHHARGHHRARHVHRGPRAIARLLLHRFHWGRGQFRYLEPLWAEESGWSRFAYNPYSGAYGIPQADPGSKMGPHWRWSAWTQIMWGLGYIKERYGSPQGAWYHECDTGWY